MVHRFGHGAERVIAHRPEKSGDPAHKRHLRQAMIESLGRRITGRRDPSMVDFRIAF
jgi:hypothetical protein